MPTINANLHQRVLNSYHTADSPPPFPFLVGYSGGKDSSVLLHLLVQIWGPKSVVALYFNHALRSQEECAAELNQVKAFCNQLKIELICQGVPEGRVLSLAQERGKGWEESARFLRLNFFSEIQQSRGGTLVTAHHGDDQAETVLMRLLWGKKLRGWAGMGEWTPGGWKPLLRISQKEIRKYAHEWHLSWWEDSTNTGVVPLRNRIRHKIMPIIESEFPQAQNSLIQFAQGLGDWVEVVGSRLDHLWSEEREKHRFPRKEFDSLSDWEVVLTLLRKADQCLIKAGLGTDTSFPWIERVLQVRKKKNWKIQEGLFQIQGTSDDVFCRIMVVKNPSIGYFKKVSLDVPIRFMGMYIFVSTRPLQGWLYQWLLFGHGDSNSLILRNLPEDDSRSREIGSATWKGLLESRGMKRPCGHRVPVLMDNKGVLALLTSVSGEIAATSVRTVNQYKIYLHMGKTE